MLRRRHQSITTGIIIDGGRVEQVRVLVFRESRGGEVHRDAFTRQYRQASLDGQNRLDRTIDHIESGRFFDDFLQAFEEHRERRPRGVGEGEQRNPLELLEDDSGLHVREVERYPRPDSELGAEEEALLELIQLPPRQHEEDLVDDLALEDYLRRNITGTWHASCTVRMGRADDPTAM